MTVLRELGAPLHDAVRQTGTPPDVRRRRTVLVLAILAACTLLVLDARRDGSPLDPARAAVGTVVGPMEQGVSQAVHPVGGFSSRFGADSRLRAENQRLVAENGALSRAAAAQTYTTTRARELDALLRVAGLAGYRMTPAQVVGYGSLPGVGSTVTIDAGSNDGVHADMTVLAGSGLVGRVVRANADSATVLVMTDPRSVVGARLESTMALGFVTGTGSATSGPDTLSYKAIDPRTTPKVGDRLVTWGSKNDAPYVPGVPIGTVTAVHKVPGALASTAVIRPFVSMSSLDVVGVVTAPVTRNPRDVLLPPKATATEPSSKPSTSASKPSSSASTSSSKPSSKSSSSRAGH